MGLLNPSEFVDGGMLNDIDVLFKSARFSMFDYGGKAEAVPALKIELVPDGEDDVKEQYWSAGGADKWQPSEDGKRLLPIGSATHLNTNTNIYPLLKSLVDAGFPSDKLGDDISVLDGLKAHVTRIPITRNISRDDGAKKDQTVLIVSKIINLPWETSAKTTGKAGSKGKGGTKQAEATQDKGKDISSLAREFVEKLLSAELANGSTTIPKRDVMTKCYKEHGLADDPNKAAITKLLVDDKFLKGPWEVDGMAWSYDNAELTLG